MFESLLRNVGHPCIEFRRSHLKTLWKWWCGFDIMGIGTGIIGSGFGLGVVVVIINIGIS